jgi:hypothetical protein
MRILTIWIKSAALVNRKARLVFFLWFANLLFSLIIAAPFFLLWSREYSASPAGERLANGMDFLWLGDFIFKFQSVLPSLLGWILVPGLIYLGLNIFFAGGLLGRLGSAGEKPRLSEFLADCGKYFPRFFRLFWISLAGFLIFFGAAGLLLSRLFNLWLDNAPGEWTVFIGSNLRLVVLLLLFSIVRMLFDYARILLVVEDSKKTLRTSLRAAGFVFRNFFRAWSLYLMTGIFFLAAGLLSIKLGKIIPRDTAGWLALFFLLQQLFIVFRMWTRNMFFASGLNFFEFHKERP